MFSGREVKRKEWGYVGGGEKRKEKRKKKKKREGGEYTNRNRGRERGGKWERKVF